MLSYRHSFHAGNFADVIKHIVLVEILGHLAHKDKPFEYIDTHSGAGLFDLGSTEAKKLEEHVSGIGKIHPEMFPELGRYLEVIQSYNPSRKLAFYPGSPSIAKYFLRPQDRAWLFELHPGDYQSLCQNLGDHRKIKISCQDGLKQLLSLVPPTSRRGLVLIDPSYEIKTEYDLVFNTFEKAYRKFATGIYAIWYPVVDRQKIDNLEMKFFQSGIKNIQQFEIGVSADTDGRGMTAAGMFVINPPWTLFNTMSVILPKLAATLGDTNNPMFKCKQIRGES